MSASPWDSLLKPVQPVRKTKSMRESTKTVTVALPLGVVKKLDQLSGNYKRSRLIALLIDAEHERDPEDRVVL